jgi:glycosyltransferase involved in cell wall biosynthesis
LKFSILLPTRERLEYLRLAVESVLRQDVEDWELVVADNCSQQDIGGYVASLADPRIVYTRSESPLPVTENWNRALAHSEGEYVVMLGDDDALLGGYLRRMQELIERFDDPEVIYTKALLFTYPGVDPARPEGFLMDHGCARFFAGATQPFLLEHERAVSLARAAMSFKLRFDFNAQFALISRRLIDRLGAFGAFYQSAFPDYYSMNAAFLDARRIVVDPEPKVVIGVTPKSYGYFHANRREGEGRAFLDGPEAGEAPGSNINVGWLNAVQTLASGPGARYGLKVNERRYRLVQAAHVHRGLREGSVSVEQLRRVERELPAAERWAYRGAAALLARLHRLLPGRLKEPMVNLTTRAVGQLPTIHPTIVAGRYRDMLEVLDRPAAGR